MNTLTSNSRSGVTIGDVAESLNVSRSSVRNWIKTGYLRVGFDDAISPESLDHFLRHVAGRDKLTRRANKSLVDNHDHDELASKTMRALEAGADPAELSNAYQDAMSNAHRNQEGIYYTPPEICRQMFADIPVPSKNQTFCDPCCGTGNFILAAIDHGFSPANVYGFDTDATAVELAKTRVFARTGMHATNILCVDFLETVSCGAARTRYDVIATNPPWGKKLKRATREKYGALFGAGKSIDSCSLFLCSSLKTLKTDGTLSFLMPESFFKIAAFQAARRHALGLSIACIRDFGKPFKGLLTRAQSITIVKSSFTQRSSNATSVQCVSRDRNHRRGQETFASNPAGIINFEACPEDDRVLARLFERPHITLEGNARWGLGIVTGNNARYCSGRPGPDLMPVYRGVDIHQGWTDRPTTFIPQDVSLYQQVAPAELFESPSKILYRFISSNLVFHHDRSGSYFLNSVNMIVPSRDLRVATERIVALFNTELFNWAFTRIFNTHKVLRTDLETMPIPIDFLNSGQDHSQEALMHYYGVRRENNGSFRVE